MEVKRPSYAKKNRADGIIVTRFPIIVQSCINKISLVLAQEHRGRCSRAVDSETSPHSNSKLSFDKEGKPRNKKQTETKNIPWRKYRLVNKYYWDN